MTSAVKVDLSDVNGVVKNLSDHQASPANTLLNERETFILIRVDSKFRECSQAYCTQKVQDKELIFRSLAEGSANRLQPTSTYIFMN